MVYGWATNSTSAKRSKKKKKFVQHSKGAGMTTWQMRAGGNQVKGRKKDIGRFKLSLDRGISNVQKFSCVHVTLFVKL